MLLNGTSITRIVELTTTDLTDGNPPTLCLGLHQAPIPPAAYLVLRLQTDQARPDSAVGRATHSTGWIFPRQAAGTHRSAAAFAARLRRHGLPARTGRNTALLALAEDLPASVLSDTLGISITAALRWTRRAARLERLCGHTQLTGLRPYRPRVQACVVAAHVITRSVLHLSSVSCCVRGRLRL